MTVTELSNTLNVIVQMHKQQAFSYPSLQYYKAGTKAEAANVNRQNNFDKQGAVGTSYPFLLMPYPDAALQYVKEGSRIKYTVDLYIHDLQFYANNGTTDNRSTIEIQRDLIYIANDILAGLNAASRFVANFETVQQQAAVFEFLEHQNNNRECILKLSLTVSTTISCSTFIFNPALLPAETPYPVDNTDYENINS